MTLKILQIDFLYFNQQFNLYISAEAENLFPECNNVVQMEPGQHLHWGENEHGIVTFGIWYDNPKRRPGHGGFWSSRPSVVGPIIGKQLVDVAINRMGVSIEKAVLESFLPEEYKLIEHVTTYKEAFKGKDLASEQVSEISYYIQRKDGGKGDETFRPPMIFPSYPQRRPS